jgi:hypothetical protein
MSVRGGFIFPLVLLGTMLAAASCAQQPAKGTREKSATVASWRRMPDWVIFAARDMGFRPMHIKGRILYCTVEYSEANDEYCLDASHLRSWAEAQRAGSGAGTLSSSFAN